MDHYFFNSNIEAYRKKDASNRPAEGKTLFVGSSVMEFWKTLEKDLSPLPAMNRGIAGTKIVQWPHYVDRLVLPYKPSAVALYAGSNDMHGAKAKDPRQIYSPAPIKRAGKTGGRSGKPTP